MNKNGKLEKWLGEALEQEPAFQVREGFADRMVKMIRKKEATRQKRFYVLISAGVALMMVAGMLSLIMVMPEVLSGIGQMVPAFVMIAVAIGVIQYLDKRLVKERLVAQSKVR